jgi:hypothetical protein
MDHWRLGAHLFVPKLGVQVERPVTPVGHVGARRVFEVERLMSPWKCGLRLPHMPSPHVDLTHS